MKRADRLRHLPDDVAVDVISRSGVQAVLLSADINAILSSYASEI